MEDECHRYGTRYFIVLRNLFTPNESLSGIDQVICHIKRGILDEDNVMLCEEFNPEEFQIAVFQMHKNKSHGPDGFNSGFYKKFWNIVGPDIVSLYLR